METLLHKNSGVKFKYIKTENQQFVGNVVVLKNLKTGKEERFISNTYLNFFTVLN